MTDNHARRVPSTNPRSANMRANRRTDTKPEIELRKALHAQGFRFRKDMRVITSSGRKPRPDIVFTRKRVAVFVDGCFWHCCPEHGRQPKVNTNYWNPKLLRNQERDRMDREALETDGWTVVRLWEHVPLQSAVEDIVQTISNQSAGVIRS